MRTSRSSKVFCTMALALGTLSVSPAQAVVIDFDSLEVANSALNLISSSTYTEDGFTIVGTPMYYAGQLHVNQYAGSAGMHMRSGGAPITLTLTAGSGGPFDINSIELSILASYGTSPAVTFTGNISGGGTVTQSFTPTVFGFTQFVFSSGFANLDSLVWNQGSNEGSAHQFDNLVVSANVPEPFSLALLGLGLAGLGFGRRRKA